MLTTKQITAFRKKILDWFEKNKRDLPWRKSRDPYSILISEVMLQQTQVGRVIPKFESWMKQFPTVQHLAKASVRDVLSMWSGLGYNRRALYLQKAAQEIVKKHNGRFSQDETVLTTLPGIGTYTARAILCFAFNKQVAVVDTNIRKVILTQFGEFVVDTPKEIQAFADLLLPKGKAYEWNQALMDYSSAELKKEKVTLPKQKPFKNSNRYYRGQILKLLLQKNSTGQELFSAIKNYGIAKKSFQDILKGMEGDNLILKKGNNYTIPQ